MANKTHNYAPTISDVAQVIQRDGSAAEEQRLAGIAFDNAVESAKAAKVSAYGHLVSFLIGNGHNPKAKQIKLSDGRKAGALKAELAKEAGISDTMSNDYFRLAAGVLRARPGLAKDAEKGPETVAKSLRDAGLDSQDAIRKAVERRVEQDAIEKRAAELAKASGKKDAKAADFKETAKAERDDAKAAKKAAKKPEPKDDNPAPRGKVKHGQETKEIDLSQLSQQQLEDMAAGIISRMDAAHLRAHIARAQKALEAKAPAKAAA